MMKAERYDSLEGLRGLMSFWVWISHVTTMATLPLNKHEGWGAVLANGEYAVGVFIILSGFVIGLTLRQTGDAGAGVFWVRRAFRLFPAYLICLFISVAILDLSIATLQQIPWDSPRTHDRLLILNNSRDYFWTHLTLHSLLLHGIVPDRLLPSSSFAFMGQAWSLTLEWQFYLIAPFAFYGLSRLRTSHWMHAAILGGTLLLARGFGQPSFLLSYLYLFAIGYFAQRFLHELQEKTMTRAQIARYLVVQIALLAVANSSVVALMIWLPVYLAIMNPQHRLSGMIRGVLESKGALFIGRISYSFYCVHMIAIYLCAYLLIDVAAVTSRPLFVVALIVGSCAASLLSASLLYRWVEVPMIRTGKALAAKLPTPRIHRASLRRITR